MQGRKPPLGWRPARISDTADWHLDKLINSRVSWGINIQVSALQNIVIRFSSLTNSFSTFYISSLETVELNYTIDNLLYSSEAIGITYIPLNNNLPGYCLLNVVS